MTSEILCVTNLKEQIIPAPILFSMTGTQYLMTHFLERNMKRSNVVPFLDSTSSIKKKPVRILWRMARMTCWQATKIQRTKFRVPMSWSTKKLHFAEKDTNTIFF